MKTFVRHSTHKYESLHANKQYNKHTAYNVYDPTLLITHSIHSQLAQFTSTINVLATLDGSQFTY